TGMIMAVPAHDQRDFEFARKYGIPIRVVIQPSGSSLNPDEMEAAFTEVGKMVNSGQFDGTHSDEGIRKVTDYLEAKKLGRRTVNYRLKDWLVSRQRYWGTPIPMIHCDRCGIVPVPDKDLPVLLPDRVEDYKPKGKSVLAGVEEFYHTTCPKCHGPAHRDPDTMDTFVDSSWYHLRYTDPHNEKLPFARAEADKWLPIDEYIGGIEHATGHLIFFRFFTRVLHDMDMVAVREPCRVLHTQGMVSLNGVTMSSSKRVGIWVGEFVEQHGADVARLTILFAAPPEKPMDWTEDLVTGTTRFLDRVWRLYQEHADRIRHEPPDPARFSPDERKLFIRLNQTIRKVAADCEAFQFNTAIAAQMELLNDLAAFTATDSPVFGFALSRLILLLAPFAPHMAEELWHQTQPDAGSVFDEPFPQPDPAFLEFDEIEIPVQVNGKVRDRIRIPRGTGEAEAVRRALAAPGVQPFISGAKVVKTVCVPDRLVNIVTRQGAS
ncbi:MAG: class I tRNA ligase family protein, partial [candidate division WOR-3 bacterium]